jgi:hypothetical protein
LSFIVRVRVKRSWLYDSGFVDSYVRCEDRAEMLELRRLLKRRNGNITVSRLGDVEPAALRIEQLEEAELRAHPEVLEALSDRSR